MKDALLALWGLLELVWQNTVGRCFEDEDEDREEPDE